MLNSLLPLIIEEENKKRQKEKESKEELILELPNPSFVPTGMPVPKEGIIQVL